ncbi:HAD-IA family hydrolase [bacterium]|nr:HAD-IA family hydrolase [bacterium]
MDGSAVLFDMDGTLLDTLEDLGLAANRMLAAQNFPQHPLDAYRYFVGEGALNLVTRTLPEEKRDEETVNRCLQVFLENYDLNWKETTRLYPGVADMLDNLQSQGYRLAILSNKPQEFTQKCTTAFLSRWTFEEVWGKRDGIPRKPDPAGALKIAAAMDLAPSDFLYLGDTRIDMETASAAGMFPIGALWGFRTKEELLASGARALLQTPMDMLQLLKEKK